MIVIPPGRFTIGSPMTENGRGSDENPQKIVTIGYAFAMGKYPVTRGQFAAFVADTGRKLGPCEHWDGKTFRAEEGIYWSNAFRQTGQHPVVCVNWDDSQAYVQWLSRKTRRRYRLLSEAEWEYAARAGTSTLGIGGDNEADQCRYANGADVSAKAQGITTAGFVSCYDKHPFTSPVGSFAANNFGLYDMAGNAGEWVRTATTILIATLPVMEARSRPACRSSTTRELCATAGGTRFLLGCAPPRGMSKYPRYAPTASGFVLPQPTNLSRTCNVICPD
jgi:formylglycine-generating enzyme required for sulfatase activity